MISEREKEFVLLDEKESNKINFEDFCYIMNSKSLDFHKFLENYQASWNTYSICDDSFEQELREKYLSQTMPKDIPDEYYDEDQSDDEEEYYTSSDSELEFDDEFDDYDSY